MNASNITFCINTAKNETNSKSNITIQKENALNYNGNFDKLLSLPVRLKGFESGLQKTIINIK